MDRLMCTLYDPHSVRQRAALAAMFVDYLVEEVERTGQIPSGLPVALWLETFLVLHGERIVGFYSYDRAAHAVELIYVVPVYRRKGVASTVLTRLRGPGRWWLRAKTPFSPAGEALMRSADVEPVELSREEEQRRAVTYAKDQEAWQGVREQVRRCCPHRARGNRARPCTRCCHKYLDQYVTSMLKPFGSGPVRP